MLNADNWSPPMMHATKHLLDVTQRLSRRRHATMISWHYAIVVICPDKPLIRASEFKIHAVGQASPDVKTQSSPLNIV